MSCDVKGVFVNRSTHKHTALAACIDFQATLYRLQFAITIKRRSYLSRLFQLILSCRLLPSVFIVKKDKTKIYSNTESKTSKTLLQELSPSCYAMCTSVSPDQCAIEMSRGEIRERTEILEELKLIISEDKDWKRNGELHCV